jgi:four helix bundle protein
MRRFLQIARGSANELEYHLLLAKDLHLLQAAEFVDLEDKVLEIQRMPASFVATVKSASAS